MTTARSERGKRGQSGGTNQNVAAVDQTATRLARRMRQFEWLGYDSPGAAAFEAELSYSVPILSNAR